MNRSYYALCIVVLLLNTPRYAIPTAELPVLNVFAFSTPQDRAQVGEEITFQADIYSTSDITETLHITATIEPYSAFAIAAIYQSASLGAAVCEPTLMYLSCDVPIRVGHFVSIIGVIDAPNYADCLPSATFNVIATLPQRTTIAAHSVAIDNGLFCAYLPTLTT